MQWPLSNACRQTIVTFRSRPRARKEGRRHGRPVRAGDGGLTPTWQQACLGYFAAVPPDRALWIDAGTQPSPAGMGPCKSTAEQERRPPGSLQPWRPAQPRARLSWSSPTFPAPRTGLGHSSRSPRCPWGLGIRRFQVPWGLGRANGESMFSTGAGTFPNPLGAFVAVAVSRTPLVVSRMMLAGGSCQADSSN